MIKRQSKIFFSGIAGSGLSAIAVFMADKGHTIAGSDRAFDLNPHHPLKNIFSSRGITIFPQDGSGMDMSFNFAVFSTAVEPDQPEALKARELGIKIKTRPEYLAEITGAFKTIAVSGTSGKSTASGMLAFLMERLDFSPNLISGGRVRQFKSPSNPGNSITGKSDYLIIEACESDGTIVDYKPEHSIILNLSLDHHAIDVTSGMFKTLIENTKGNVLINNDDINLCPLTTGKTTTFSISAPSGFKAENIIYSEFSTNFLVKDVPFSLSLPDKYNVYNALSCIALLSGLGAELGDISKVLPEFQGIDRRFDVHLNDGTYLVVDDYAHNPHKIESLMKAAMRLGQEICYIFQPHGFGPTKLMKEEYISTFSKYLRDKDHLILLPIYYAGGTASKDISSHDLADAIKANGKSAEVIDKRKDVLKDMSRHRTYIIFGARDESLSNFAEEIADAIKSRD